MNPALIGCRLYLDVSAGKRSVKISIRKTSLPNESIKRLGI